VTIKRAGRKNWGIWRNGEKRKQVF